VCIYHYDTVCVSTMCGVCTVRCSVFAAAAACTLT
jgi:hypothetical protein